MEIIRDIEVAFFVNLMFSFLHRLQILTETIYQNISFFSSVFKHIDMVTTILHYLTEYSYIIADKSLISLGTYSNIILAFTIEKYYLCYLYF